MEDLSDNQKKQIEFVQFHPGYDYSDFVEGLHPRVNEDGSIGFQLRDGVFKQFVSAARKSVGAGETQKSYVFIIDEINRGEISKILGELFFSINPGYRSPSGVISTQYSNMHSDNTEKFYIPENVYIIGTMNDIARSVDSFDFAMRCRFRFVELTADSQKSMLNGLVDKSIRGETVTRMDSLNVETGKTEDLNENYHIGPAYFLKLNDFGFDDLWKDYLAPLL
ncbi:McrB family protein [Alloscardovia sp. HMSC034E08]|uniref:McrB family protein n=1 Tax=Alloscardovia sp. HMSC034E08 TaxID=1739413 RepID=UPI000A763551|nr:AAA family ATPase [Alloscardovia sp. HMSC034E08]